MKRILCTLLLALGSAATLLAQALGTVSGRVIDANTGLALEGVRVQVAGTAATTFTGSDGRYTVPNVEAGSQTLRFSYVGYDEMESAVEVSSTGVTRLDAAFEVLEMEAMVIQGAVVGTARAINAQRAADTLSNIVASDAIGSFPDQNAAEALQRVPGLSLYRDQGEGRYIVVRGINYALNNVQLDGVKLASPEEGDRGIALDVIPADAMDSVEVTKVPTPDMDGEGIGGTVNIKSKSAFDHDGMHASFKAQGIYSALSGKTGYKFNGKFSTVTEDGKLGLLIAPTWQVRKFGSYNYENDGWSEEESPTDGNDYYFLEAMNYRDYVIERERYGVSAAIEGRPNENLDWYVRGNYNRFKDTEQRYRTVIDFTEGDLVALDANSATIEDLRRFRRDLRDRVKDQDLQAVSAGFDFRNSAWTIDGKLGYSKGHEESPDETQYRFRRNTRDGVFTYDFSNAYDLRISQLAGASIENPASYELQRVEFTSDAGDETEFDALLNARYDFGGDAPSFVKFGGAFRSKEKTSEVEVFEYSDGPDSFSFANLAGEIGDYPFGFDVPRIDRAAAAEAFFPNLSSFDAERVFEDSELDDWVSNEDVLAGYVMGSTTIGRTTYTAGVRVERTKFDSTGKQVDLENEVVLGNERFSRSYTNWLPGVYLRHDLSDSIVLRASFSNSLSRPSFGSSAARIAINHDDEEVFLGNPALEALESTNWDASVEYYLPSLGVMSASVFYKDIKNFSYEYEVDGGYAPLPDYELTTFANGSSGEIRGLELAYQQQLTMLAAPFDGFGVMANVTFADSEATYPTRPGETLDFIGNSDLVGNLALTYERKGFFARLALNHRSERLREDEEFGGDIYEDVWVDDATQLDLTVRYRVNHNWEIFGEWANITNEPFRVFFKSPNGGGDRLGQWEEYDWTANFGVRWSL
ncbi:TonB-dependent receptor [Actomonas aquatica]|uniref:TonB-dependent receptor n=1 Tax=Actomonas aquatica TaxID=2866162 RepID=A0ABZ1C216_9BACT|nr:TonB-dependent receptor [Opitutus sp. WL0086]WRQ85694.1 TonB-dependent receptor [Opitutus sp. WL0086]